MNIGELDKRIAIYNWAGSTDSWNHEVKTKSLVATVWASVIYKGGDEKQSSDQKVGVDKIEFLIRHKSGLTTRDTVIKYGGFLHDVHSIETIGRNEGIRLITTLRDNNP
jgi:head-tail adaptor